jgi:chromate reductase
MDMTPWNIAVVVGSIAKDSINRKLAGALAALAPPTLRLNVVRIDDLPLCTQDYDTAPPAAILRFKADISAAAGVLFVTPEHNRSVPAALKNALDLGSRPYGKSVWAGKPAAVIGASPGALGTALAQQHLRNVLASLDVPTLAQPEAFIAWRPELIDAQGRVTDDRTRAHLQKFVERYATWVERFVGSVA